MSTPEQLDARKYRSRKQKPCDNCRTRRTCCIRNTKDVCALCQRRGVACTFNSDPPRRPTKKARDVTLVDSHDQKSPSVTADTSLTEAKAVESNVHPMTRYVGLSGAEDPFFMNPPSVAANVTNQSNSKTCQQVGADPVLPAYFKKDHETYNDRLNLATYAKKDLTLDKRTVELNYSRVVHPSFPVLDKLIARKYAANSLLLNAMNLIADPCNKPRSKTSNLNVEKLVTSFFQSFLVEIRRPSLELIEAGVLFAARPHRAEEGIVAPGLWALIGSLVGTSHDLGLNADCSNWDISNEEKKQRRRLWWAVYMQDKWLAMALGRPSFLHDSSHNVPPISLSDFGISKDLNNTFENYTGICGFVAMTELTVILCDVLTSFYNVQALVALRTVSGQSIVDMADRIDRRLEHWNIEHLQPLLLMRSFPDPSGSIELAFLVVKVMLLRAVGPKLYRRSLSMSDYLDHARHVAMSAINLVETLQINRLSAFWPSYSSINLALIGTFMVTQICIAPDQTWRSFWVDRLSHYRKILRAHAAGFEPAKIAALQLDQAVEGIKRAGDDQARAGREAESLSRAPSTATLANATNTTNSPRSNLNICVSEAPSTETLSMNDIYGDMEWFMQDIVWPHDIGPSLNGTF